MTEQEINPEPEINRVLLSGRLARDPGVWPRGCDGSVASGPWVRRELSR
jgi:hypothetical protein